MARAGDPDISVVAAAIGQSTRGAILRALLAGEPLTVKTLATRARVSPATASVHLKRLSEANLVTSEQVGRTRRYELANLFVAQALEALQRLAPPEPVRSLRAVTSAEQLVFARSCYDHLAGQLGVAVTDALVARDYLKESRDSFTLTATGGAWLEQLGLNVQALRRARRGFALRCIDWSEGRPHLAGAVGAALLERFLAAGWLKRKQGHRSLELTPAGGFEFRERLGVDLGDSGDATA
jgi:DNA-binding transcriptional ArsR family regulator